MVHVNPVQVIVDPITVLWLNAFACNLTKSLSTAGSAPAPYIDLRLEAIMPRLVLETTHDYPLQRDRPSTLQLQTTRLLVCNYRSPDPTAPGSLAGLTKCLERLQAGEMAFGSDFPARDGDLQMVPDRLVQHTLGKDHVQPAPADVVASVPDFRRDLPGRLLWEEPRDVVFIHMDPFWGDFFGTSAVRHRPVPFIDAIPVSMWVYQNRNKVASVSDGRVSDLTMVLHVPSLISLQLNHFQYLFLLRQLERLSEMSALLTLDAERLLGAAGAGSQCVSAALPQLDISLLMPCLLSSKDSSGGDLSVFPDSSSVTSFQEAGLLPTRVDSLSEPLAELGAGLSQVKRGLNSFLSSLDSALKSPDDQSDTMSVMSDMSSDSDSYVLLNLELDKSESVDPLFVVEGALKRVPSVEIASEVTEDTHSEVSLSSAMRKRDVISALTLRLGRVELVHQGAGLSSSLKLNMRHFAAEQCAAIGWDEFQAKFQLRTKGWQGLDVSSPPCSVRLRMDSTFVPVANQRQHRINIREQVSSELEVRASELELALLMSTVTNLTDFIEDEILPVPLPMELYLEHIKLRLTEDRPPNNITSPGVVPLDLRLPAVHVTRDGAGVFTVQQPTPGGAGAGTGPSGSRSLVDVASSFNNPASGSEGELGRLRRRCQLLEDQLEQRRGSEQRLSQLTALEARCREAEDEVLGLREEKEVLMKTLSYLKQEFLRLDTAHSRRTDAK
ncbi:uncharacterized protein LOC119108240 [Pollicipes pollicipes]|uniref:uncharacterized protein LOC119108240 n=1 Tax=Pollicipes pollicipes TaxID=41117 RepID=UPI00188497A8|nr:uncharacterized protein LOC119108240 [Pollicipes pollicipes]